MRGLGFLFGLLFCSPAHGASVVPNFTRGTVTSETKTTRTVTEVIRQTDYTTGYSYTVTGTNVIMPDNPGPDSIYTLDIPGAPFQFSETYTVPGIATETAIDRTTTTESFTTTLSVFTQ